MAAVSETSVESLSLDALEQRVVRKVTRRLIPFLCLLYFVNILDRVNISFARFQMFPDLHMGEKAYAIGAGIFSIGYCALEVPSNLVLNRVGARRWIARILVSWGLISAAMVFTRGAWSFCLLRFLLGCAEAGFYPGILLYLTLWFPARHRAGAVAMVMMASPLVLMLGGPMTGALLEFTSHRAGLAGWQWVFLLEGLPAVLLGVMTFFHLTDRPEQAAWLSVEEKAWLAGRFVDESQQSPRQHNLKDAALDPRVWHLVALAVTIALGISGMGYYLPRLIQDRFPRLNTFQIGGVTAVAGTFALASIVAVGMHSDRTGQRRTLVIRLALIAAAGWTLSAWRDVPIASLVGLVLANSAMLSMWGPFWTLPTAFLGGRAAAGGIALINAIGNLGAVVGPIIIGLLFDATGSFLPGLAAMALTLVLAGVLALTVRNVHFSHAPSAGDDVH
jgi:ACS family tartrate transporter-like MFS transporter